MAPRVQFWGSAGRPQTPSRGFPPRGALTDGCSRRGEDKGTVLGETGPALPGPSAPRPASAPQLQYFEVIQHGPFLGEEQRAGRALEDADALGQQVLVEVGGEEGFVGEDRVTHGAFEDHPMGRRKGSVRRPLPGGPQPPAAPDPPCSCSYLACCVWKLGCWV